jgi:LysM domain
MAFVKPLKWLAPLLLSSMVWADNLALNPNHPNQYTVVSGDTLWDIAGRFLQHPSQWPELWNYNSQIRNPHRIYPGDTVYFSMVDGQPRLSFARDHLQYESSQAPQSNIDGSCTVQEEDINTNRTNYAYATGTLSPCIRVVDMQKAINLITLDQIDQFLTSPRVVGAKELDMAPYIVDLAGEHLIASSGDKLYVRGLEAPKDSIRHNKGITYTVYRPGDTYNRAGTGQILGYEATYIGEARLEQVGNPATVTITKTNSEIRIGDRLMPNLAENLSLNYFPRPPEQVVTASIISVLSGVSQIGRNNVVVIDRGTEDGLLPGHELDIYKRGRIARDPYSHIKNDVVKLPDEFAGTLMVFRPFEHISYALVMKATQAIHLLDKVQTP